MVRHMTNMTPTEQLLANKLREVAAQLEKWAAESLSFGWSTHQVSPMQAEATAIFAMLGRVDSRFTPDRETSQ
jgi:hypothetical protein